MARHASSFGVSGHFITPALFFGVSRPGRPCIHAGLFGTQGGWCPVLWIHPWVQFSVCSFSDTDFGSDASSHGMLLFCVGSCATFLLSASAHLLHNKNERAHYTLFCLDYIGISLYAYTYGMMTYYSSGNREFYESPLGGVFPVLHAAMAVNQTIWCILARVLYKSEQCFGRKCLMVGPCALGVLSSEIPLLFRLYGELHAGFTNSIHLYHLVFSVTNGLTFALHQPENSFPGRFDHWGSGHQWFHLSSVLCAAFQLVACHTDLVLQPRAVLSLAQPNVVAMWGSLATVIAANMVIYGSLYPTLMKRNGLW